MKNKVSKILTSSGVVCILLAATMLGANIYKEYKSGVKSEIALESLTKELEVEQDESTIVVDGREYMGILEIPSRSISLPIQANWSEELLEVSPTRYQGNIEDDTLIIMGHNYRKHFSPIKSLEINEKIKFTDVNGVVYLYSVSKKDKIHATDVEEMVNNDYDLTLFTCDSTGESRVAIRCDRLE